MTAATIIFVIGLAFLMSIGAPWWMYALLVLGAVIGVRWDEERGRWNDGRSE